jgi:adenine phosphoribosyltransferase
MEVHEDAFAPGENVLIIDDLIATGGTAFAAVKLIEKLAAKPAGASFVVDLPELGGLQKLRGLGIRVEALCAFEGH